MEQVIIYLHLYKKSGVNENMDIYACMDIKYTWKYTQDTIDCLWAADVKSKKERFNCISFFDLLNLESYEFITFTIFLRSVGSLPRPNKIK